MVPPHDPADRLLRPLALREGLQSAELGGEIIIYDGRRTLACRLNQSAARVWTLADGTHTIDEIAELVSPGSPDRDLVLVAFDQLNEAGLLQEGYDDPDPEVAHLNRRRFIQRAGIFGAAMIPVVEAVLMPAAAHAESPVPVQPIAQPVPVQPIAQPVPVQPVPTRPE